MSFVKWGGNWGKLVEITLITLFIAGALGALAKDIIQDGEIVLPKKTNGKFSVGFLGGMITGGVAGYFIDGNPTTAFLAGYAGTSVIEGLITKNSSPSTTNKKVIETIIRYVAKEEGVDPDLAVRVADCESKLSPSAENCNTDGSRDRGIFQINNKWHPEIDDATAFDIVLSTRFFCKAFKEGHLDWWSATKSCWEKK